MESCRIPHLHISTTGWAADHTSWEIHSCVLGCACGAASWQRSTKCFVLNRSSEKTYDTPTLGNIRVAIPWVTHKYHFYALHHEEARAFM